MGTLQKHPIARWRAQYRLGGMVETGTWNGDGVLAALAAGYGQVTTVDVDPAAHQRCRRRLPPAEAGLVEYILGDSASVLPDVLDTLTSSPVLWWLDAHYPERYGKQEAEAVPLVREMEAIMASRRRHEGDVFCLDDMRIYGHRCSSGPVPGGLASGSSADMGRLVQRLNLTHIVRVDSRDEGYLIAVPK